MGVISKDDVDMLRRIGSKLMQKIKVKHSTVLRELLASGTLTEQQVQMIKEQPGDMRQVEEMLECLRNGTTDTVRNLRAALYASEQGSVAEDYLGLLPVNLGEKEPVMPTAASPSGGCPTGVAILGDCVCATGYFDPNLWLHNNTTGDTNIMLIVDGFTTGMAAVDNDTLIITDTYKKLNFIVINQQRVTFTSKKPVGIPFEASGVSVDAKTDKLVLTNRSGNQIMTYDRSGKIEPGRTVTVKGVDSMCCAVAIGDEYAVLDGSDKGGLYWVSKQGIIQNTCEGQCQGKGLSKPCHMVLDSDGRLIVVDKGNDRLLHISPDRKTTELLLDGIVNPRRVCLDKSTGRLYVACGGGRMDKYTWPSTSYIYSS